MSVNVGMDVVRQPHHRSVIFRAGRYSLTLALSDWQWRLGIWARREAAGMHAGPLSLLLWVGPRP